MSRTARLSTHEDGQSVHLPSGFCFKGMDEVFIRRDEASGDLILSAKPLDWLDLLSAVRALPVPDDFLRVPVDAPPCSLLAPEQSDTEST